jgi:uncharacterized membrane protein YedE/YeeE
MKDLFIILGLLLFAGMVVGLAIAGSWNVVFAIGMVIGIAMGIIAITVAIAVA